MSALHFALGIVGCILYIGVATAAVLAAGASERPEDRRRWAIIAAFFVALAVLRGSGLEYYLTNELRVAMLEQGLYEKRREFQRPLSALAVVLVAGALYFLYLKRPVRNGSGREWSRFWAWVGITLMLGVITMRLISFHELDRLLYGPVRINWILDLGSSMLVAFAALRFRKVSGAPVSFRNARRQ